MTLQQLTYLVKVAECGNITDAAEQLYISQPSLSTAIRNLEKEMGVTAFNRTKKGVTVTRDGEELLSFARMLLEQADIMKEHFGVAEKRDPKFSVSCQHYSFAVNAFVDVVNALQHMSAAVTSIRLMQAVEPTMQSLRYCLARRMQPVTIWSLMMRDPADLLPARSKTN